MHKDSD